MDRNIDLNVCNLVAGALWVISLVTFGLISANIIDGDLTGIGLAAMGAGSTLYLRRLHLATRQREAMLLELGRISDTQVRPELHRIH